MAHHATTENTAQKRKKIKREMDAIKILNTHIMVANHEKKPIEEVLPYFLSINYHRKKIHEIRNE